MSLQILNNGDNFERAGLSVLSVETEPMQTNLSLPNPNRAVIVLLSNYQAPSPLALGFRQIRAINLDTLTTLESLLSRLNAGPPPGGWENPVGHARPGNPARRRPLAINAGDSPFYLIVKLGRDLRAQFMTENNPAPFRRARATDDALFCNARAYDPQRGLLAPGDPTPQNCQIALFEVHRWGDDDLENGYFTINLESQADADGNRTPVIIDPQVRHPEGAIPPT